MHVAVHEEEVGIGAREHDDAYVAVVLERVEQRRQRHDERAVDKVRRRVVDDDVGHTDRELDLEQTLRHATLLRGQQRQLLEELDLVPVLTERRDPVAVELGNGHAVERHAQAGRIDHGLVVDLRAVPSG